MKITLENKTIKKINAPYSIGYIDDFLDNISCKKIFDEISAFKSYDDLVMDGRKRVNKGSKKFEDYLKKSPNLRSLYEELNSKEFYKIMADKLDIIKTPNNWHPEIEDFRFSKQNYGEQSFNILKYLKKTKIISYFFKRTVNLDMDFSSSKKGYFREAHRDRDTRVISFLIYLNTIDENEGGQFEVYKLKKEKRNANELKRFPDMEQTVLINSFPPKAGQLFIFLSSPNSYHGVSKFLSEEKERVFVYGSYSLDRKVNWKIEKN